MAEDAERIPTNEEKTLINQVGISAAFITFTPFHNLLPSLYFLLACWRESGIIHTPYLVHSSNPFTIWYVFHFYIALSFKGVGK
jgi:uncharacterized protein (DUF2062 family)